MRLIRGHMLAGLCNSVMLFCFFGCNILAVMLK